MYKRQVPDHFTPNKDIQSATQAKVMRDFVREHGITNYFEVGRMGIEHVILPEKGLIGPGEMIIGADSHLSLIHISLELIYSLVLYYI